MEDLQSGEGHRVAAALTEIDASWKRAEPMPIEMPGPEYLSAYGEQAPKDVVSTYFNVLRSYPAFSPTPSPSEVRHAMIEALVRYGQADDELAHELALILRTDFDPGRATQDALDWLQRAGFEEPLASTAAARLVNWLLDWAATRPATIEALRRWIELEDMAPAVDAARPRLNETELARLKTAG